MPTRLVLDERATGRSSELSLCDSAAKWTTASCSATSGVDDGRVGDVADDQLARGRGGRPSSDSRLAA